MSKEKTAKIIPNAVGLATATEKHVSASITSPSNCCISSSHLETSFAGFWLAALAGFYVQVYDARVEEGHAGNAYHGRRDRNDGRRGKEPSATNLLADDRVGEQGEGGSHRTRGDGEIQIKDSLCRILGSTDNGQIFGSGNTRLLVIVLLHTGYVGYSDTLGTLEMCHSNQLSL